MRIQCIAALALVSIVLPAFATAAGTYTTPTASAANGRIEIGSRPARIPFYRDENPVFLVGFRNISDQSLSLPVTEYLGGRTIGIYAYEIVDQVSGTRYRVGLDPAAPLPVTTPRTTPVTVAPTEVYRLVITLPGAAKQFVRRIDPARENQPVEALPPGDYALQIIMRLPRETVTLGPIPFRIADEPRPAPVTPHPPSPAAVAAARQLLQERLELHRKASPQVQAWRILQPGHFALSTRRIEGGWRFEFRAEVKGDQKAFQLNVTVDNNGRILSPESDFHVMSSSVKRSR